MNKMLNANIITTWLARYGALMGYFEGTDGYGQYIVTLHGRRAVAVAPVSPRAPLPVDNWQIRLIGSSTI